MSATSANETPETVREQVIAWRRHLHQHPELSFHERETSQFVADTLAQIAKDLNIGVVALFVNIAVIALVTVASPRRAMERAA